MTGVAFQFKRGPDQGKWYRRHTFGGKELFDTQAEAIACDEKNVAKAKGIVDGIHEMVDRDVPEVYVMKWAELEASRKEH